MLAGISANCNSPFGNKESCENFENSERSQSSDTGFSQPSCLSKSPLSSPELSRGIPSFDSPSIWSFMEASCSLIHEEEGVMAVSNLEDVFLADPTKQDAGVLPGSPSRLRKALNSSRSVPHQLNTIDDVTLHSRSRSSDFTLTEADGMAERPDSVRTLGDAINSPFPHRSTSASTAQSDSSNRRAYVATLVKRRREIEERLADLKVKLLESYREEWILTGVLPKGFAEIQSQVFAFDPKLKTTSFPFTHFFTSSQSESNFRTRVSEKPSTISLPVTTYGRASGILNSLDESTNCKDSLTSSFSSIMADSFYFCQSDDASPRTSSFIESSVNASAREVIIKRLENLKNDSAVISQIYRVHRQRAFETNQSAFRKACKCNVQKLKEIQREKVVLEAKLREIDDGKQLSLGYSRSTRSSSVSMKEDHSYDYPSLTSSTSIGGPSVATLPRRRTLRIPSLSSTSGTLRLGKLKKRSSVKQTNFESTPKTPIIGSSKPGKIGGFTHTTSGLKALRFPLLPARFRMPRSHTLVARKVKTAENPVPEIKEISYQANTQRPYSMYATAYSSRACSSMDDLYKSQLQRCFSTSFHDHLEVEGSKRSDEISPLTPNELKRMLGSLKVSSPDKDTKDGAPSSDSDEQSTSGTFSMISQEFSLMEDADVCLRRPMLNNSQESPIRCICSCISEHGGNCDCSEENSDDMKEEKRVDSGVGQEEEETTPKPSRSKYPVIMPGRQLGQSRNPFHLLWEQSGRRGSLWK